MTTAAILANITNTGPIPPTARCVTRHAKNGMATGIKIDAARPCASAPLLSFIYVFFFLTAVYRARVDGSPITSFTLVTVDVSAFPLRRQRAGVYSDFVINIETLMTVSMAYTNARTRTDQTHLFNGVVIAGSSANYHA